ncbi:hypothetical protein I3842_Q037600 [Carya illinoinensis]|uniref:Uncharacterized protein n=1 Tax=Carya illinoinensis TaxID=32201 RepID=A0A922A066_CARIL|nr:hypothetical protein I3842_Q128600 [Carya illinoinensis]KAG6621042.1 hypothetical protein I3842_Q035600 [Carya illinoinensis]KAG6621062.1 hypothetical protein I3842_Q037600 [Carya illinoinensis]
MCLFIYLLTRNGSRFDLKKDLRVSRVGPGGRRGTSTLGERSTPESCMLRSGRMNRSRKGIY